jgi:hypothetical protein
MAVRRYMYGCRDIAGALCIKLNIVNALNGIWLGAGIAQSV